MEPQSPNLLLDLPAEIRLHIFESCPDHETAFKLAQLCRRLRNDWNPNKQKIAFKILKQTIKCYDAAKELLETVHATKFERFKKKRISEHKETDDWRLWVKFYRPRLLADAKAAEAACDTFQKPTTEEDANNERPRRYVMDGKTFSQAERQRYIYVYYKVRTLLVMVFDAEDEASKLSKKMCATGKQDFIYAFVLARSLGYQDTSKWDGLCGKDALINRFTEHVFGDLERFEDLQNQFFKGNERMQQLSEALRDLVIDCEGLLEK
ncbi:MAG: hypothetical protein Q9182_006272 [Xanthomendoza sp. 2 TL-2023]